MEMVMCRSCGKFIPASLKDEKRVPKKNECPDCGGTEFKDTYTDRIIDAGDE